MRFLELLNEIDWSKNIILLIVYIMVVFLCVMFYLIPIIENHKIQMIEYKQTKMLDTQINSNANSLKGTLQAMLEQNKKIYNDMRNKIDIPTLESFLSTYLHDIRLSHGEPTRENDIEKTTINIIGTANSTKDITELITNISNLDNSIRISFPLKITKQGDKRAIELSLTIYTSTYNFE